MGLVIGGPCDTTGGPGTVIRILNANLWHDSAEVLVDLGEIDCPDCLGRGHEPLNPDQPCPNCEGTGKRRRRRWFPAREVWEVDERWESAG